MVEHEHAPLRALIVMPLATRRGGAEHQFAQLIEHRRLAGIEPTVAFLRDGPLVGWCRDQGVEVVALDAGRVRNIGRFARTVRMLRRAALERRVQVVIGWMGKGQLYAGPAATAARIPGMWLQVGIPNARSAFDRVATLLPTRRVVTVSRLAESRQRALWPRRPTAVVYPAVDLVRFNVARLGDRDAVRRRLGLPTGVPIFGSVGRLDPGKGFDELLAAVPTVLERRPEATLVLVGGPHELAPQHAEELRRQAARLSLNGQVRLVGEQPNPEEWIQAMDVFVQTSRYESFGMVLIEAMALGKPVISTARGGPAEIVTSGVDGLLVPGGDQRAVADALLRFLEDGELRRTTGNAALRRAEDFTVERFAREFGAVAAAAARASR